MPTTLTPLRYPGGKTKLFNYVLEIFEANNLYGSTYIEPFAGGAGLAIKLLLNKKVSNIVLNDIDPLIYAFWYCVLNFPNEICSRIECIPITVEEWEKHRYISLNPHNYSILDVGFATFFMNRTNVSGIISGGMIGGKKQEGNYKLDARFNRQALIQRIQTIQSVSHNIQLFNKDAKDFILENIPDFENSNCIINFDPPYVKKGSLLYRNSFTEKAHIELRNLICNCKTKWIVTYDKCSLIHSLYYGYKQEVISLQYSTGQTKTGDEIVVYSNNMEVPPYKNN